MSYNIGDKFIIEIDSKMTRNGERTIYGIKGFNSLVFDDEGLKRLTQMPDEIHQMKEMAMVDGARILKQQILLQKQKELDNLMSLLY